MLDYDREAARYDETRGGYPRADAAGRALCRLLPEVAPVVLDVGGGTGIVAEALTMSQRCVFVCDTSHGMLGRAVGRLPGRAVRAEATKLPVADGSIDALTTVWLLHLLEPVAVEATVCEAARVLRPGGRYVTTVDKAAAHAVPSSRKVTDGRADVTAMADLAGLRYVGEETFVGHGQRSGADGSDEPVYTLLAFEKVR